MHVVLASLMISTLATQPGTCENPGQRLALDWGRDEARITALRDSLTTVAQARPKDGESWLSYGTFLVYVSSEADSGWRTRLEAEKALEQAFRLLPGDPRPVAALGVLRRKQGARIEARRLVNRAVGMADRRDAEFEACFKAEIHYQMALVYRTWWEDWDGMHNLPATAPAIAACSAFRSQIADRGVQGTGLTSSTIPDAPAICAREFYEMMEYAQDWSSMRHADRDAMIQELGEALAADPTHRDARRDQLLAWYDLGEWDRFDATVSEGLRVGSDPWVRLWASAGAYARRRFGVARAYLDSATALLTDGERRLLLEPERVMAPEAAAQWTDWASENRPVRDDAFWQASDPLFLTDENERLLAHASRVLYASAKFGVPGARLGVDTDAGNIWVRYGVPLKRWTFRTGESLEGTNRRTTYWTYDSVSPPIILDRLPTRRLWRLTELAHDAFERNVDDVPQRWLPSEAFTTWDSLPVQIAQFEHGDTTVFDAYGWWSNPDSTLTRDSVGVGFFVFDAGMRPLVERRLTAPAREAGLPLMFRVPLAPSVYRYSIETMAEPGRAVRRARGVLELAARDTAALRTSDLLVGRRARTLPTVIGHRDQLHLAPLYDLVLEAGDSLVLYWETYGLVTDTTGVASYTVAVSVEDSAKTGLAGLVGRLGAALGLGSREGVALQWNVEAPAVAGVRRDVVVLDPPEWSAGVYVLKVTITEARSGRQTETERVIRVPERDDGG